MGGLHRLDGDDDRPQERTVLLSGSLPRPTVEVRESVPRIVHVVEPVAIYGDRFTFDELTDVDVGDAPSMTALALRRATADSPWELVPTVDAEGLVLRIELGAPGGVAQLGDDGKLRPGQTPDPPVPPERAWTHTQLIIASLWQIRHDLGFDPAGVYVEDQNGTWVEPERVTYPIPGEVIEIRFGLPVYGTARLS